MSYKQKLYKKLRKIGIFIQAELSKDDAEALIDKDKALRQKVNAYRSTLPKEILGDDNFYKYWRCREEANYLYRKTKDVNEYYWYKYKPEETTDCFVFQNPGNGINNPILRYNEYHSFTGKDNHQDTITISYEVDNSGTTIGNKPWLSVTPNITAAGKITNLQARDDVIDGKYFVYGGDTIQETLNKMNNYIAERNINISS